MQKFFEAHEIDNSALIHLAMHSRTHSNVFRLEVHLRSVVRPAGLQQAADAVAVRFPMLAAGIRSQGNTFMVVPRPERLFVWVDKQPLVHMTAGEIGDCAMRVLYGQRHIAVEFFHSLTDGAGGLRFLRALLSEYLGAPADDMPGREGWEDSYRKYAVGDPSAIRGGVSYLLPSAPLEEDAALSRTTLTFSVAALREKLQKEHLTLTAFFTALFAQTAMEVQRAGKAPDKALLPVRIMVPVDLRRRFPSATLRNFSLYALPELSPEAADASFPEITESMAVQLRAQSAYYSLRAALTANVKLEQKTAGLPLWLKCAALRAGFEIGSGRGSCITVSNLGQASFPESVRNEIERLDFMLTPRIHSPYNCGIVSTGDLLSLTITRRGEDKGVEKAFLAQLEKQGVCFWQSE